MEMECAVVTSGTKLVYLGRMSGLRLARSRSSNCPSPTRRQRCRPSLADSDSDQAAGLDICPRIRRTSAGVSSRSIDALAVPRATPMRHVRPYTTGHTGASSLAAGRRADALASPRLVFRSVRRNCFFGPTAGSSLPSQGVRMIPATAANNGDPSPFNQQWSETPTATLCLPHRPSEGWTFGACGPPCGPAFDTGVPFQAT